MASPRFLTGQLLLAMPGIGDPRFERAVIAICSHDEGGAMGIGIGRLVPRIGLHGMLRQFEIATDDLPDCAIHMGGPCEVQRGFILHSRDWSGPGTIDVAGKWALSASIEALKAIGREGGPRRWLVALGYAGWSDGQLDAEMLRHGWHLAEGTENIVFETEASYRWEAAFGAQGIDPRLLVSESGRA